MLLASTDTACARCCAQLLRPGTQTSFQLPPVPTRRHIRSIVRPQPKFAKFNLPTKPNQKPLRASPAAAYERKKNNYPLRTGLLAIKRGMTALYDPTTGERTPCTVVQVDACQVISHKTLKSHGYAAVQVGSSFKSKHNITRPLLGHYAKHEVSPKKHVTEFKVRDDEALKLSPPKSMLNVDWLIPGQFLDVQSVGKGKGFSGGMKKHGWSGQPASHGNSLNHRTMGSAGQSQGGGSRVYPGKKMAGRMGGENVTCPNVEVLEVHPEKGVAILKGCFAGHNGCVVKMKDALRRPWPEFNPPPPPPPPPPSLVDTTPLDATP